MPELPEVETVRAGLANSVLHLPITKVLVNRPQTLLNLPASKLQACLQNDYFKAINRQAKYLFMELASGQVLMVHLKMTGSFALETKEKELVKHTHLIFEFENKQQLRFIDLRAFGRMALYPSKQDLPDLKLAPEPLSPAFSEQYFYQELQKYQATIKHILLDQHKLVSGLGNIYTDEALFLSNLHPSIAAHKISQGQASKLYYSIQKVIAESIDAGGTTIRNYRSLCGQIGKYRLKLWVYGRKKENCLICQTPILYFKLAGRGTHYCPACQPI